MSGRLEQIVADLATAQRELAEVIAENTQAINDASGAGGEGGGGVGAGGGGGRPGGGGFDEDGGEPLEDDKDSPGGMFAGRLVSATAGLAAVAAVGVGSAVSSGITAAAQGGTFGGGFASGVNRAVGAIPVLGEALNIAPGVRVEDRTIGRAQGIAGDLAAAGVQIGAEGEEFLVREFKRQEIAREQSNQRIRAIGDKQFEAEGNGFNRLDAADRRRLARGVDSLIIGEVMQALGIELFK